jgi:hypothetical protein
MRSNNNLGRITHMNIKVTVLSRSIDKSNVDCNVEILKSVLLCYTSCKMSNPTMLFINVYFLFDTEMNETF